MEDFRMKYRPQTIDEIWGNEHIKKIWSGFVARNKFPRSIILHGNYGTGKTTMGRIMMRDIVIKKSPPSWIPVFMDMNEIDATRYSYETLVRRADHYFSSLGHPSAMFIDEAHRFPERCQEVFLKPIESEYYPHFIFATPYLDKIDDGIQSRSTILCLKHPEKVILVEKLTEVVKEENINISSEAISLLIERAGYNPRKCLGYLNTLLAYNEKIDIEIVKNVVEIAS